MQHKLKTACFRQLTMSPRFPRVQAGEDLDPNTIWRDYRVIQKREQKVKNLSGRREFLGERIFETLKNTRAGARGTGDFLENKHFLGREIFEKVYNFSEREVLDERIFDKSKKNLTRR